MKITIKIENGMTYDMVVALFGDPGIVQMEVDIGSPEYKTVNYQWGNGFEYCAITFQGGKVSAKMQFGLKKNCLGKNENYTLN